MRDELATTGSQALLDELAAFVPDDFVNALVRRRRGSGRRSQWSPAQLYRLLLLTVLTPARSFNLLVELLKEQRGWRKFARLQNRFQVPTASQLHDFRHLLGVAGLRRINEQLLRVLLDSFPGDRMAIGLIDSTDLPAAASSFKKNCEAGIPPAGRPWVRGQSKRDKAGGSSAIKSTRCVYGCHNAAIKFCLSRWYRGWLQPTAMKHAS
jgi:hypothetical protein